MTPPIIKISAYPAWVGKDGKPKIGCVPHDTDFYSEIEKIKAGGYSKIVAEYRHIKNPEQRDTFKKSKLPSLTISGRFKKWRKTENLVEHSGLLNIDIDAKPNPNITDWPALRDQIFKMDGVVASFISVSGRGVTFVVRVLPENHKDSFFSIVDGLKTYFGIQADTGLHDVTRLRFVSDDPDAKIRYDFTSIPLSQPSKEYLESKKYYGSIESSMEPIGDADSEYNYGEAVKRAERFYNYVKGHRHSFLTKVAGACNVMGMSLGFCEAMTLKTYSGHEDQTAEDVVRPIREIYKLYKHQHASFNIQAKEQKLNETVRSFLVPFLHEGRKPSTDEMLPFCEINHINLERIEYFVTRIYNEFSDEFGYNKFPQIKKVEIWLSKRFVFALNIVTAQPEIRSIGNNEIETVNPDEIYRQLRHSGFKMGLNDVKSLLKSSFVNPYDPIENYFKSLNYDSTKDHIENLANYITTAEGDYWPKQFKKSLVRCIACGLGKKENRIVMVLYGRKQETGKTTFIRFLSPWGTDKYFTESPIIGGNAKDTEIRFSENFMYNLEELAGLNRADINKLKADISKSSIKERRAYAAFEVSAPRRCNFWASTNQKEFLHDEENTRWLIFEVTKIDWSYKTAININNVWAQAWDLYKTGFNYELDDEDRAIREYLNQDYRFLRPEEELLARYFKPTQSGVGKFMSATEIAMALNQKSPNLRINSNNIGKTMMSVFQIESVIVKIEGKNTRGYWVNEGFNLADGENRLAST